MSPASVGAIPIRRTLVAYDLYPANIPGELKRRRQWVTFTVERVPGRDKLNKVPRMAGSDRKASTTDSETWCSFEEALSDVVNEAKDGLGFVFSSGDPYTGIDWDRCILPDGTIDAAVLDEIRSLGTYAERSLSGSGVHAIVRGKVARAVKGPTIEIYCVERFFVMTGDLLDGLYGNR